MKHALHTLEDLLKREDPDAGARGAVRRNLTLLRPNTQVNPCWFMWVPECFNIALDIQQTMRAVHECPRCGKSPKGHDCPTCKKKINRVTVKKCGPCGKCTACENGEPCLHPTSCDFCNDCGKCKTCRYCPDCQRYEVLEWTQGSGFNFTKGDTFYDTPQAYPPPDKGLWSDALKCFRYCIEVTQAAPSISAKLPPKETKTARTNAEEAETRPRYPGRVEFKLFVPNEDKTGLTLRETGIMTQDDFVRLLISGESPKLNLKWSDILL